MSPSPDTFSHADRLFSTDMYKTMKTPVGQIGGGSENGGKFENLMDNFLLNSRNPS
jgi:hypothetical protein